jgi:hypothetical protein
VNSIVGTREVMIEERRKNTFFNSVMDKNYAIEEKGSEVIAIFMKLLWQ